MMIRGGARSEVGRLIVGLLGDGSLHLFCCLMQLAQEERQAASCHCDGCRWHILKFNTEYDRQTRTRFDY
jgi:hypothetical protein